MLNTTTIIGNAGIDYLRASEYYKDREGHDVSPMVWRGSGLASLGLILDGIDGRLARRHGLESPFGARFDMEVDAFFILVLAALVYQTDKAGGWVLLSGVLRYGFVAFSLVLPWLNRPLPPRPKRQALPQPP